MTNDLDPETLDTVPTLFFRLQLQRLIELIRGDKVMEALDFAEEELAPLTASDPVLLAELEETMALLAFPVRTAPQPHPPSVRVMGARGADGGTRYLLSCAVRWRGVSVTCVAPPAVSSGDRLTRHLPVSTAYRIRACRR
jgi:hypothetical protein